MLNVLTGRVNEILESRDGVNRLRVAPDGETDTSRLALNYPALSGPVVLGDRVLLNTTATDLELGTGGWDFVIANLTRCHRYPQDTYGAATPGHLMKLRYTPQQFATLAAEEAYPDGTLSLGGRPVLVAELHSHLVPALLGLGVALAAAGQPPPRVAYLMPDTAALPLAFSDTVAMLRERGLLSLSVTCGHAFGGEIEAVNIPSGMTLAVEPGSCDALIVAQGPGNAGTGSAFGFGGAAQADALHAAVALGGDAILIPRVSAADLRPRHRGVSHHTRALLETLLLAPVTVAMPDAWPQAAHEDDAPSYALPVSRHGVDHPVAQAPAEMLSAVLAATDLPLKSMGRGWADDPVFFLAAAAGGWVAGQRLLAWRETQANQKEVAK